MIQPSDAFVLVLLFMGQMLSGAAVAWGAFIVMVVGTDRHTHLLRRLGVLAIFIAGCTYVLAPLAMKGPTATGPDILFASVVGYALLRHGRQVRGVLDGDWDDTRHFPNEAPR